MLNWESVSLVSVDVDLNKIERYVINILTYFFGKLLNHDRLIRVSFLNTFSAGIHVASR